MVGEGHALRLPRVPRASWSSHKRSFTRRPTDAYQPPRRVSYQPTMLIRPASRPRWRRLNTFDDAVLGRGGNLAAVLIVILCCCGLEACSARTDGEMHKRCGRPRLGDRFPCRVPAAPAAALPARSAEETGDLGGERYEWWIPSVLVAAAARRWAYDRSEADRRLGIEPARMPWQGQAGPSGERASMRCLSCLRSCPSGSASPGD